jgi:hypothetical protein
MIVQTHAHATLLPSAHCPESGTGMKKISPFGGRSLPLRTPDTGTARENYFYMLSEGPLEGRSLI